MTLGQHLRADQDIGTALGGELEGGADRATALHGVRIDALDAPIREVAAQRVFETLVDFVQCLFANDRLLARIRPANTRATRA